MLDSKTPANLWSWYSIWKYLWIYRLVNIFESTSTHIHIIIDYYRSNKLPQFASYCSLLMSCFYFFCFHSKSTKSVPIGVPLSDTKLLTSATLRRMLTKDLVIKWTVDMANVFMLHRLLSISGTCMWIKRHC